MSSSEDNADDVASPRNTHSPRQSDEGISEGIFRQLLVDFAKWYDGLGYINMLKVLYKDHVPIYNELNEATEVMSLLRMLIASGNLSSKNLTILYDTIIVTGQFGFKSISLLPSFQSIKEREVFTFTRHRQKLMRLGMTMTTDDIRTLDGLYNMPLLKNYRDSWSLILDLEQRKELCGGKLDEFTKALPSNSWAGKALPEGNSDDGATSSSSHAQKQPDKVDEVAPPISKRPHLESQDVIIREYLLAYQKNMCSNATRFTPAIMRNRYHVDIAHMFTDLKLVQENNKEDIPTTLEEVLEIVKSSSACKVLIEGEAGIGKSTLLRYVAYSWASNKSDTFKGKIVFLVNIRNIDKGRTIVDTIVKEIDLEELFVKTDLPDDPKLIRRFIMNHDDDIVILLDGLDELRDGSESPISFFERRKMKNSKVMLTSRCEQIDEFIKNSNVHVKVQGFSRNTIEKYIKKHFDYMRMPALADSLTLKLQTFSRDIIHSKVYAMCKNPMLLLAICNMWEDRQHLPNDIADLCKELFRCILNQFNKQTCNKISRFEDIPENVVKAMLVLGKCMYEGLKVNRLYINRKHLEGNKEIVDLALNLGFVYKEAPSSKADFEIIFTTHHKFTVESLVAFYLYKICQAEGLENKSMDEMNNVLAPLNENEWEIIRKSTHLRLTRDLAIQFLGANAAKFLNHWITNNWLTYHGLIEHLNSMPEKHREAVEKALIDHMTKTDLEIKPHIDDVCNSMRKFIHYINPDVEVSQDEHFIKLKRKVDKMIYLISDHKLIGNLCKEKSAEQRGRLYAHMWIAAPINERRFNALQSVLTLDDAKYLTSEYQRLNIKLEINHCALYNASITTSYLVYILSNAPQLKYIHLVQSTKLQLIIEGCTHCFGMNIWEDGVRSIHRPNIDKCNRNLSGVIMSMIRECSIREVKLKLQVLDISGNNLSNIDGFSLTSLLIIAPEIVELNMNNCSLSGVIMNDMIRECSSKGVKLKLRLLDISSNNLSHMDGCTLASLFIIAPKLYYLYMNNYCLSGVMNDMIRESGDKLELSSLEISSNNFSNIDGCSQLASLFMIDHKLVVLHMENCSLSGIIMNDVMREFSRRVIKLELSRLTISKNNLSNIDGCLLASLCIIAPKLDTFYMKDCGLSGGIMKDMIRECLSRGVKLSLGSLEISSNNLSNVDGCSLASLFIIAPKLNILHMQECSLSGVIMNDMIRECLSRGVKLQLSFLTISSNNLSNIDGCSLAFLLINASKLSSLYMTNCSLRGVIMNDMIRECSGRGANLNFSFLDISSNNMSDIDGCSLASLLVIAPRLSSLHMEDCSLSGVIMNGMTRECSRKGVKLKLFHLQISSNNLSDIDGSSLFIIATNLYIENCSLSGITMNDMIRECSSRRVQLMLNTIEINSNNLSNIDGCSLASLSSLRCLYMNNCSLSGDIMNDMIRECLSKGVKLSLRSLEINSNNLSNIDGCSLASLLIIAPRLSSLHMEDCSLSGVIMNDMIRECSSREVKLELIRLQISSNDFSNIDFSSLASLLVIAPELHTLLMTNCNLSDVHTDFMNRECSIRIELAL
ncbi:uncharacterized protein LOC117116480 [Anneissia japonica]|uniref:uncharacterized protein LOC117116480 n=1 Tax=Anneissia japonica TaxID=1529436 RepID=UPI0014258762|nr:uncharacterized protein LOC117116480 [Anneissia japonica]XP_033116431.1 uncharacterized protein LOC117116480 [Anneissia japonica]